MCLTAFVSVAPTWALPTAAPATQPAENRFIRFVDDGTGTGGGALQVAILSYRNEQGVLVDLIGAVHVGDRAYYEGLNTRFEEYDALLYELVKPKDDEAPPEELQKLRGTLGGIQRFMKDVLHLEHQLQVIDYEAPNFVHADMNAEDFFAMQHERGESIWTIMFQSMMGGQGAAVTRESQIQQMADMYRLLTGKDKGRELKLLVAHQMGHIEDTLSGLGSLDGTVLLTERNKAALAVLKQTIEDGSKKIGVFYGAAHLNDMDKRMADMGFTPIGTEWLTAWDVNTPTTQPAATEKTDRDKP